MPAVAVLALGYLPGWATARWLVARTGTGLGPARLSPFTEVLLSLCLSSWLGFALAEAGAFSLRRLTLLLLVFTGIVALLAGRGRRPACAGLAPIASALALAGVIGIVYLPPFDTSIMGSDASFYLGAGVHLGRYGTLAIADPLLAELGPVERRLLFPPNVAGGWARVAGGLLLPSLDTTVVHPSFSHLLPVWIAIFHGLGGLGACGLVAPVFAGLGLWAFWLFVRETRDGLTAVLATALLATNLGQWFYGRFLMPEIVTQPLLWGGLLAVVIWWRDGSPGAAVVAALALGVAGLARIEDLFLLPLAALLFIGWSARRPRTHPRLQHPPRRQVQLAVPGAKTSAPSPWGRTAPAWANGPPGASEGWQRRGWNRRRRREYSGASAPPRDRAAIGAGDGSR